MLVADDTLAIDHEGFRHPRRPDRQLHFGQIVASDMGVGIAMLREEAGNILGAVANGDAYYLRSLLLEAFELLLSTPEGVNALKNTYKVAGLPHGPFSLRTRARIS